MAEPVWLKVEMGHSRRSRTHSAVSALPPKTNEWLSCRDGRNVPLATSAKFPAYRAFEFLPWLCNKISPKSGIGFGANP